MKTLLPSFFALFVSLGFGQSAFDQTVSSACECLNTKENAFVDQNSMQAALMECVQVSAMRNITGLMEEKGISDMTDMSAMTKMGQEIGSALMVDCPAFQEGMQKIQMDIAGQQSKATSSTLQGELVSIDKGPLTSLNLKTSDGSLSPVYWIDAFEGDEILLLSPEKMIQKNVQIQYTTRKMYSAQANSYKTIKVLTGIALMQK